MKIVLTGGPCSGKSTLIDYLKKKGYEVVTEAAREVISLRLNKPLTKEEFTQRQRLILIKQEEMESKVASELVFLDRGIIDSIAYCRVFLNYVPDFFKIKQYQKRYSKVFLLERFPFENDGLRVEKDDSESERIHQEIERTYNELGYNLQKVPVMDVESRANFILNQLKGGD